MRVAEGAPGEGQRDEESAGPVGEGGKTAGSATDVCREHLRIGLLLRRDEQSTGSLPLTSATRGASHAF